MAKRPKRPKQRRFRIKGKFATRAEWQYWQQINREAKVEKKQTSLHLRRNAGRPRDARGRFIGEGKGYTALDLAAPRAGSREAEAQYELAMDLLSRGEIPKWNVSRQFLDPSGTRIQFYRYEWRFYGFTAVFVAELLLERLIDETKRDPSLRVRVIVGYGRGPRAVHTSSRTDVPQRALLWLRSFSGRPSAQEIFEKTNERNIYVEIIVVAKEPLKL